MGHFRRACGEHIRQRFGSDRASAEAASSALDAANRVIATLQAAARPPPQPQDPLARQLQAAARFWAAPDAVADLLDPLQSHVQAHTPAAAAQAGSKRARGSAQPAGRAARADRGGAKRAKHSAGVLSAKAQLAAAQLLDLVAAGHRGAAIKVHAGAPGAALDPALRSML